MEQKFYTKSALSEKLKLELAAVKLSIEEYLKDIKEKRKDRRKNEYYYDYDLELDFSKNPKIPFDIDERWYYYKTYHYQKLGLFLRKDAPPFKVRISHLSLEMIYQLVQLNEQDRKFVLKQAVSRIFEDINFNLYHN